MCSHCKINDLRLSRWLLIRPFTSGPVISWSSNSNQNNNRGKQSHSACRASLLCKVSSRGLPAVSDPHTAQDLRRWRIKHVKRLILSGKSQLGWLRLDLWTLILRAYLQITGSNQTAIFLLMVSKTGKSCAKWPNSPLVCPQPYCHEMRDEGWILTVRLSLTGTAQSPNTLNRDISWLIHFSALDQKHSHTIY